MAEIDFLLAARAEEMAGRCRKDKYGHGRVKLLEEKWHGFDLCLHRIPENWMRKPEKVKGYVEKQKLKGINMWTDSGLDALLKGENQPLPSAFLAEWILERQPFRPVMIINCKNVCLPACFRISDFVERVYRERNGLYLIGEVEVDPFLLEAIYEDSGLAVGNTDRIPETDGRCCVVVELGNESAEGLRRIPAGSVYLDLTSDPEKQRYFAIKRRDISYISARNFLDTALKTRYNAF